MCIETEARLGIKAKSNNDCLVVDVVVVIEINCIKNLNSE